MEWQRIWEYQEQDYRSSPCQIEKQVQVVRMRLNHYGNYWRVQFSNLYGLRPLVFDKVTVQVKSQNLEPISAVLPVLVAGQEKITLQPGVDQIASEGLALRTKPGDILELITYLSEPTAISSFLVSYARLQQEVLNFQWQGDFWQSPLGQYPLFQRALWNERMYLIYGISGLQMLGSSQTVVAFGDSLTQQGFWTDHLKQRLWKEGYSQVALLNRGIGGNRILTDTDPQADPYSRHGRAAVKRYLSDVFAEGSVNQVLLFHGINDCLTIGEGDLEQRTQELIAGFRFFIQEAKLRRAKVIAGTLLPFGQSQFYTEKADALRQRLNHWLRTTEELDGLIDFERVAADAWDTGQLKQAYDCGDGLHLSSLGGQALAQAVDLEQLLNKVPLVVKTQVEEDE